MRDMIDAIAEIAYPHPRAGDVEPPEADAVEYMAEKRQTYAENLRNMTDATGGDPLLAALENAAAERDAAQRLVRALMAYGRHFVGGRGYGWPALAGAARLPYSTARRQVGQNDIAAVGAILGRPANTTTSETERPMPPTKQKAAEPQQQILDSAEHEFERHYGPIDPEVKKQIRDQVTRKEPS